MDSATASTTPPTSRAPDSASEQRLAVESLGDTLGASLGAGLNMGAPQSASAAALAERKKKKFGKVKLGGIKKKVKVRLPTAAPIKKSLKLKRQGIRKPSKLMVKTLKKLAKKREMEMD